MMRDGVVRVVGTVIGLAIVLGVNLAITLLVSWAVNSTIEKHAAAFWPIFVLILAVGLARGRK